MRVLRSSEYKRMPWKNGGGETIEIMVSPPAADFTSMDWRLSMATVASDGPFSSFPGIDRTLAVLSGTLRLSIDGANVDLMEMSPPHSFSGDAATHGAVLRGPVTDLNVMTRRSGFTHEVRRLSVMGEKSVIAAPGTVILFCHTGSVRLDDGETLKSLDTAVGVSPPTPMIFRADVLSTLYVIAITPR
jgi:environmental stress-induced protein Ves